jgi:hypothetical protein
LVVGRDNAPFQHRFYKIGNILQGNRSQAGKEANHYTHELRKGFTGDMAVPPFQETG